MLSLEDRRLLSDEIMLHKLKNNLVQTSITQHFHFERRQLRTNRQFYLPFVTNNVEYHSPILRIHRQHMEVFNDLDLYEPQTNAFKRYAIFEIKQTQIVIDYTN